MKNLVLLTVFFCLVSCTEVNGIKTNSELDISITSKHKIISNQDFINETFLRFFEGNSKEIGELTSDLYRSSWIYAFKFKRKWPNKYYIQVKEHQPLAIWKDKKFLTQSGISINPNENGPNINLIILDAPEADKFALLNISRQVQSQLNRFNSTVHEVRLTYAGYITLVTKEGAVLTFSKKNFREQLERLEDFISFELFSGKLNNIRTMDFRYKNGISVLLN